MKKAFLKMLTLVLALMLIGSSALAVQTTPFSDEIVTLTAAVKVNSDFADPEDSWFWNFCREVLHLNIEVEYVTDPASYNQLSFAAGNMPDLYVDMRMSTIDVMTYGVSEQQLVALDEYIDNGSMPNLAKVYEQMPHAREIVTCPDGHIYSLGIIRETDAVEARVYWNVAMLEEQNLAKPTTLEELVDVMYKLKEVYGENFYPMTGSYEAANPMGLVLNSMGYITRKPNLTTIALRNGTPVFPFGDREAIGDFLTMMNQFYNDGIISPDFFTIDKMALQAQFQENNTFVLAEAPFVYYDETFDDYDAVDPLTSVYSDTKAWPSGKNVINCGNLSISTNCENLDAALFFVDWMYDPENYVLTAFGPQASDTDLQLGITSGWTMAEGSSIVEYADMAEKGYESRNDYQVGTLWGWWEGQFGFDKKIETAQAMAGLEPVGRIYNLADGDDNYRQTVEEHLQPYEHAGFPEVAFFTAEDNAAITDLKSVLESYAVPEIAKFITGARSLNELEDYFNELDTLGYQEYVGYYVDYYNNNVAK